MNRQYDYKAKWTIILLGGAYLGASLFLGAKAMGSGRDFIFADVIDLAPQGAAIVYWVLTAASVYAVVLAALLAYMRLVLQHRIVISENGLILPRSRLSGEKVSVPFANVQDLKISVVYWYRFAKIVYEGGQFTVNSAMLPKKTDFDAICAAITAGMAASRSQDH